MSSNRESSNKDIYEKTLRYFLQPVYSYIEDAAVSEIMINGPDEVFIERQGFIERTDACFVDEDALYAAARNIAQFVGKGITRENQSIEARLPDGSRVHITTPPSSRKGLCMSIRKFSKSIMGLDALVSRGAMTDMVREFITVCVVLEKNIIVSGGTGSGKTTLLNAISSVIPERQRIIVLEDSSELQFRQPHVLQYEAVAPDRHGRGGMTIRELFRASLRMRPDRIIIGEVRGGEALDLIQAMTSGHSGSLSTAHANSPADTLRRLETMALMASIEIPLLALRAQIASAVDLIIQVARLGDGSRKITHISEVMGLDANGDYRLQDIFRFIHEGKSAHGLVLGALRWTGARPAFSREPMERGLSDGIDLTKELFSPGLQEQNGN